MTEENKKQSEKIEEKIVEEKKEVVENKKEKSTIDDKIKSEKGDKVKKEIKKKESQKPKKTEAVIKGMNLPISAKYSFAVCKFIKNKKIEDAILDLEMVLAKKKAVPMKGEIPHKKGKGMMSGRYPKKTSEHFIKLLKNLQANSNVNGLDEPIISEAIANFASRPHGKFGSVRRKRANIEIKCKDKKK